jgi:hypothetical protein
MTNELAYPFTLTALDGTQVELAALHGEPILLLFFNIGCAGCTGRALPLTLDLSRQYPELQLVAIHSHFSPAPVPIESIKSVANYFKLPSRRHTSLGSHQCRWNDSQELLWLHVRGSPTSQLRPD